MSGSRLTTPHAGITQADEKTYQHVHCRTQRYGFINSSKANPGDVRMNTNFAGTFLDHLSFTVNDQLMRPALCSRVGGAASVLSQFQLDWNHTTGSAQFRADSGRIHIVQELNLKMSLKEAKKTLKIPLSQLADYQVIMCHCHSSTKTTYRFADVCRV